MRNVNLETQSNFKSCIRHLAMAALFTPLGLVFAHDRYAHQPALVTSTSGHVEVVHQIPGGVVTVGVEFGRPKPVIVEERHEVVVERPCHRQREVTIIRERPRRHHNEVIVIKTTGQDRCRKRGMTSYQTSSQNGSEHYYEDANQVSYQSNDQAGSYHYYEDANQVSVQDNRNGQNRNIYVRK
jgi:hypothetical protein